MNIYNAMNTAKNALLTHQTAIEVTGQNIANVNNPDYNRQDAILKANVPINTGLVSIGTGVTMATVQRRFDQFAFNQTLEANFNLEKWNARETVMNRLDLILNETDPNGISSQMSGLFQGFYNLAINPGGMTERQDIVSKAASLAQKISSTSTDLKRVRQDIDAKMKAAIPEINRISAEIVRLNKLVHETETSTNTANDYRDMRDAMLTDLSKLVDVSTFEQSNNEIVVMMNNGRPLVVGESAFTLSSRTSANDPAVSEILWADAGGNTTNILNELNGGQMGAWVQLRDTDIPGAIEDLDKLAGTLIRDINRLHSVGYGLDGSTGTNLFNGLQGGIRGNTLNTGSYTFGTASVTNPEVVNLDNYRVTLDGAGNYSVYNTDKGSSSGTYTFTSGAALSFFQARGLSVSIAGTAVAGDSFYVSGSQDAAYNMAISSTVSSSPEKVAAGATKNRGDGTQARRIADLQYKTTMGGDWSSAGAVNGVYAASGLFTFDDYLGSVVGGIGSNTQEAQNNRAMAEAVSNQSMNLREQISGVNLDEEMVNLVKYQHAYGAAAKMITTVDELLQTLLNLA